MASERGVRLVKSYMEKQPIYDKSWAIVVGINEYSGGIPPLSNAVNDASAIADVLRNTFHFDEVHTLYNDDATRRAIMSWLRDELHVRTRENDRVIVFFAGHGITQELARIGKRGYLIPFDAELRKYADYIDMRELLQACSIIPAKHIFIILDCCFSGIAAVTDARSVPVVSPDKKDDAYLRRITQKRAWQILTAGDSDDVVADSGLRPGHSVFTQVLLDGLEGAADYDNDALFTATDLAAYVKPRVTRESAIDTGLSQTPFFNYLLGSGQGDFVFSIGRPSISVSDAHSTISTQPLTIYGQESQNRLSKSTVSVPLAVNTIRNIRVWQWGLSAVTLFAIVVGLFYGILFLISIGIPIPFAEPETSPSPEQQDLSTKTNTPAALFTNTPIPAVLPTSQSDVTKIDKYGVVYIYIPAGEYRMGSSDSDELVEADEMPQHSVYVDAFWIMQTEVTNEQYRRCVETDACTAPYNDLWNNSSYSQHPVTDVSWNQANNYAEWIGGRLPTEAEWEKACRGIDNRIFPWGNQAPSAKVLNYNGSNLGVTTVVGTYPPGANNLYDMAGNVWEWTADWYDGDYYNDLPLSNPTGPEEGDFRVLRGGSWINVNSFVRCANRDWYYPDLYDAIYGFRVVISPLDL